MKAESKSKKSASPKNEVSQAKDPARIVTVTLPDGRIRVYGLLGEFKSIDEAKPIVSQILDDVATVQATRQMERELTESDLVDGQNSEQLVDEQLRELCSGIASTMGLTEFWESSQTWPEFPSTWNAWRAAWDSELKRKFPESTGRVQNRYTYAKQLCLVCMRSASRGRHSEIYQRFEWLIRLAARMGDAPFFLELGKAIRHKVDPRIMNQCILLAWMPAGLWCSTAKAASDLIFKVFKCKRCTKGSVRSAWHDLGLAKSHSRKPIINGWTFSPAHEHLLRAHPIFFSGRARKV